MTRRTGLVAAASAAWLALATLPVPAAAGSGLTVEGVTPDTALQQLFDRYGDSGRGWTGADTTYSVPLPGHRDAWLFSDTFLGPVNPDHSRPADVPFIHNSIVVQRGEQLTTDTGGTMAAPESLVGPTPPGPPTNPANVNPFWYWSGDGAVEGGKLRVFYMKFVSTGPCQFCFRWDSDAIATFSGRDELHLESLTPTVSAGNVTWGSWVLRNGGFTYVYGVEDLGLVKYMHLARAREGDLLGAWQFWTGTAWSSDPSASGRIMAGVGNEYSVTRVGDRFVLVTMDTNVLFSNEVVAYSASSPTGPFTRRTHVYSAPEAGGNIIVYNAHAHPELSGEDRLVVSYNVNSFVVQDVYRNVEDYRPRFIDVRLRQGLA